MSRRSVAQIHNLCFFLLRSSLNYLGCNAQGLDFVISEAGRHGVHLILSLVNNFEDFGGRKQYVKWARDRGQNLNNDDEFYTNSVVKEYYKNHVKV